MSVGDPCAVPRCTGIATRRAELDDAPAPDDPQDGQLYVPPTRQET